MILYIRKKLQLSSVIRQKGKSKNGCFKKTKHAEFPPKWTFLTPWYAHVLLCIRGYQFFGKFGVLCFLETPVFRFALLRYYQRTNCSYWKIFSKWIAVLSSFVQNYLAKIVSGRCLTGFWIYLCNGIGSDNLFYI